jgi:hypothetical protein
MYPSIGDQRFARLRVEELVRQAEHARLADEVRRAGRRPVGRGPERRAPDELGPEASRWIAVATPVLRDQGMPPEEIDAILRADDPEVICRYLELHGERLEERLADQRRTIGHLVDVLTRGAGARRPPGRVEARGGVIPRSEWGIR